MGSKGYIAVASAVLVALVASAAETDELFQRVKARMAAHLAELPNYTCHETIDRVIRNGREFRHLDTVELEVAFVDNRHLFSRPGENRFGEQPIEKLAGGGTIGDGVLGSHIDMVLSRDMAEFRYAGECKKDGRKALRFDLHVPVETSTFLVRHNARVGVGGYEGSVWVDPETLDPIRVDYKVNRIPPSIGVRLIEESMHYKKLTIGKSQFDVPERSELGATDDTGAYSLNTIKLSGCREFSADSVVKYGEPVKGSASRTQQDPK